MLKFMDVLSLREKNIIIKRYGLYGSDVYTQKDIARIMGISRSYVSRLEKRALIKLYKEFYRHNKKDL
jgi:RNA polymerase sporulation-specific sigma factor